MSFFVNKIIFFRIKKVFLFSLPPFGEIVVLLAKAKQFTLIWKDSISFKIVSSLSVRFFNSFKSKYLNFFFYLFDCQVSCPHFCAVVGLDGLEPSTSRLSGARSSHLSYRPVFLRLFRSFHLQGFHLDGGDEGNRTLDPLLAGQVLSQLSYTPIFGFASQDSIES